MAPLIVLIVLIGSFLALRLLGAVGVEALANSIDPLRYAFAAMFVLTGAVHFVPRVRDEMIRMIPPALPKPAMLVALTGVLELVDAIGLVIPALTRLAAWGLAAMLVAMFPANIHAARAGLAIAGERAMPLRWRMPLQVVWIALLVVIAIR